MSPPPDLPECVGSTFNCSSTSATCHNSGRFNFDELWDITIAYWGQCGSQGPWLFSGTSDVNGSLGTSALLEIPPTLALKHDICEAISGSSWTVYPGADIWQRLTTWKFPLLQLVSNSPRPPLSFWVEAFVFVHLLGDPVGAISDLLRKVDSCQSRAIFWQNRLDDRYGDDDDEHGDQPTLAMLREELTTPAERKRFWKSFAIIIDSFDEWGLDVGDQVQRCLSNELTRLCAPSSATATRARKEFIRICYETADSLAADRATSFLPVTIAQAFFISSVAIAMIRTQSTSTGPNPTTYTNIEMYSIAFTAQYFWVIFAVIWTSIIGVSQTAQNIPRILTEFRDSLDRASTLSAVESELPIDQLKNEDKRIYNGGVYSWQPARWWTPAAGSPTILAILAIIMVVVAAATGQIVSALVPPVGWDCRSTAMMAMFVSWILSYGLSLAAASVTRLGIAFWTTLVKDLLVIGATFGIVIATQFGIYNRCSCYDRYGLQLPQMPAVKAILTSRLGGAYPAIVTTGIAFQLVIVPGLLVWRYRAAVQVFLARDDGESNREWWRIFQRRPRVDAASAPSHDADEEAAAGKEIPSVEEIEVVSVAPEFPECNAADSHAPPPPVPLPIATK